MLSLRSVLELRDAGFLLRKVEPGMCMSRESADDVVDLNPTGDPAIGAQHFFKPLLSELIAACGPKLHLHITAEYTNVTKYGLTNDASFVYSERGETPEEAVKNLWISLQKIYGTA